MAEVKNWWLSVWLTANGLTLCEPLPSPRLFLHVYLDLLRRTDFIPVQCTSSVFFPSNRNIHQDVIRILHSPAWVQPYVSPFRGLACTGSSLWSQHLDKKNKTKTKRKRLKSHIATRKPCLFMVIPSGTCHLYWFSLKRSFYFRPRIFSTASLRKLSKTLQTSCESTLQTQAGIRVWATLKVEMKPVSDADLTQSAALVLK